jgi:endonuclease/exonuclease/phosphatase (EEP) superfamily protein YafD
VTSDWINQAEFTSEYQFKVEAPGKSAEGTAVFSRFPLEGTKEISPGFFKTLGLTVRLTEHTILHLVALHAPPPQVDLSLEFRRAYFNLLDTYVSSLPTPDAVLLAGDFNTTPASDSYRTFVSRHSLRNVAEGRGLPNTWSLQFCPSVGAYIDQILHRGAVEVVDLRALDDFGSDHRPLLATLRISAR